MEDKRLASTTVHRLLASTALALCVCNTSGAATPNNSGGVQISKKFSSEQRSFKDDTNRNGAKHGWITIEAQFSSSELEPSVGLDCCGQARDYMSLINAGKAGYKSIGTIKTGKAITIETEPGEHEIFVFDKRSSEGLCIVNVVPGETQRLVCRNAPSGGIKPTDPEFRFEFSNVTAGLAKVAVEGCFADKKSAVEVSVGEVWYKNCHPCAPGVSGAFLCGSDAHGKLKSGETKIFEVPAGKQVVAISGGDFLWGKKITVDLRPGETTRVQCIDNLSPFERALYPVTFLIEGGRSKPFYRLEALVAP